MTQPSYKLRYAAGLATIVVAIVNSPAAVAETNVRGTSSSSLRSLVDHDMADGKLSDVDLLSAALVVSGTENANSLQSFREDYGRHCDVLRAKITNDQSRRAAAIFRYMHDEILTGEYDADCSKLSATLSEGRYNCVSATILYQSLCRELGVRATAVSVPGHVRTRIHGKLAVDVETTYPRAFDLSSNAGELPPPQARTIAAVVSENSQPRELTDVQLVAKILYNRGVRLLQEKKYVDAIEPLRRAFTFDQQDRATLQNLLAALINQALECSGKEDFEQADSFLTMAVQLSPRYPLTLQNELHVYQKWAVSLCDSGRYADALRVLERGYQRRPQERLFREGRLSVASLWMKYHFSRGEIQVGMAVLNECRIRLDAARTLEAYEVSAVLAAAEHLERQRRTDVARELTHEALALHPQDSSLQLLRDRLTPLDL